MATLDPVDLSKQADRASACVEVPAQALTDPQKLSIIFEIGRLLATREDLETMFMQLLSILTDMFEAADAGVLRLYDVEDDKLVVKAAQGYHLDVLKSIRLSPGETTSGRAFQSGQVELFSHPEAIDAARANRTQAHRESYARAVIGFDQAQSLISMPLITDKKVGTLTLENRRKPGSFVQADVPFWRAVADLIALAIENALLGQQLQETQSLNEANRLKAELISTLAHEMRTPLTSIKGYSTALLMDDASFGEETKREFLEIIDAECDGLQDLIHDLLESSIIDAGLLRVELQPVRLPRLAQSVVEDMARRSEHHQLVLDFPPDFPIVEVDPQRIAQVLRNLLDNAIKYSLGGGLVVVRGEVLETEVVISVADQGVGLAPEDLNRLFEKFFRAKTGLSRHVVGSGLGLPIAHTIIDSHGGRIWAESKIGEGTTLYFTIPLRDCSQDMAE
jgi:signal transduction histidine kinase